MGMKSSGSFQPAGRDARKVGLRAGGGRRLVADFGACRGGFGFRRAGAALDDVDVLAGGGAGEQDTLERDAAQDASVEVGEDGGEVGCAEAGGDGVEVGGGGALADSVDEVAAVAEQVTDDVEEDLDVVGRSGGGGGVVHWAAVLRRRGVGRQGIVSGYGKLC